MKTWIGVLMIVAAGCSAAGSETTQTFEFDYPNSDPAPVVLEIDNGLLNVMTVEGTGVQGQVTTNVQEWLAQVSTDADGTQRVVQSNARNQVIPNVNNRWDVEMGNGQPVALTVKHAAADTNLDLGVLPLRTLEINGANGDATVTYASANPVEEGVRTRIHMANGDVTISGVFNSHALDLVVVTAAGNPTIEFGGGTLIGDLNTSIETTVGDVTLRIPIGTAAQVMFTGASGRVMQVSPDFVEISDNVFETAEYASGDRPHVQIAVRTVAGDLTLLAVPTL